MPACELRAPSHFLLFSVKSLAAKSKCSNGGGDADKTVRISARPATLQRAKTVLPATAASSIS